MKKTHFILLIVACILMLFSAYSLAAISQIYDVDFEWYSQYNDKYSSEPRETEGDRWMLEHYPKIMEMSVIQSEDECTALENSNSIKNFKVRNTDFDKYILLDCTFGKVYNPEYRIKVTNIAQRGNVVEVKVSMNSPASEEMNANENRYTYYPEDIVKIDRTSFPERGKLYFIFKNQSGKQIGEKYCEVK